MAGTLHDAALTGDVESVREALARGEDVNGVSADGETALHVACTYAHDECVAALLAAGDESDALAVFVKAVEHREVALAGDAEAGLDALRDQGFDEGMTGRPGGGVCGRH